MIDVEVIGDLWKVTLNRPDKANSLTKAMLTDLADIAEQSTTGRVLVLTGHGKVFSAGADLDEARLGLATDPIWERLSAAIATHPGLTLAALNGTVAGGAMGMVLACDLRIATPQAKVFYPVMKLGFLPQPSDPARLKALVGPARAKLILMAGAKLTAQDAKSVGLFDLLCEGEKLMEEVEDLSKDALTAPLDILQGIKKMCG